MSQSGVVDFKCECQNHKVDGVSRLWALNKTTHDVLCCHVRCTESCIVAHCNIQRIFCGTRSIASWRAILKLPFELSRCDINCNDIEIKCRSFQESTSKTGWNWDSVIEIGASNFFSGLMHHSGTHIFRQALGANYLSPNFICQFVLVTFATTLAIHVGHL